MTKNELKALCSERQNGLCAVSGLPLPLDPKLYDLDRILPGSEGGKYTLDNVRAVLPQAHRDIHENTPSDVLADLRSTMREYRTWVALRNKINNHFLAYQRRMGTLSDVTGEGFATLLKDAENHVEYFKQLNGKQIKWLRSYPIVAALLKQKGIGPIYVAEILTTLDPYKAPTRSSFWKYVGLAGPSKDRYQKGEKSGGNKPFRSVMYNVGMNLLKGHNPYYEPIYRDYRVRLDNSNRLVHHKGTMKNGKSTTGAEIPWKDTNDGRRHMAALRKMNKHFLGDLWVVWRRLEGLPTSGPYVGDVLEHTHIVQPEERGW